MHNSLQFFFLSLLLFCIAFFDSVFFDLMRSFLILRNSSSLVFVFMKLNLMISFFLSSSKCFF